MEMNTDEGLLANLDRLHTTELGIERIRKKSFFRNGECD